MKKNPNNEENIYLKKNKFTLFDDFPMKQAHFTLESAERNNGGIFSKIIDLCYLHEEIKTNSPYIGNGDLIRYKIFLKDLFYLGII